MHKPVSTADILNHLARTCDLADQTEAQLNDAAK
jgi:hypothetical protein